MTEKRRQWAGEGDEILRILKRHLVDRVEVSKICEEENIQPSQFYRWQAMLFSEGAAIFQRKGGNSEERQLREAEERIASLELKLHKKNEVLSELLEEHVKLKKELGES
jgi:transposase